MREKILCSSLKMNWFSDAKLPSKLAPPSETHRYYTQARAHGLARGYNRNMASNVFRTAGANADILYSKQN